MYIRVLASVVLFATSLVAAELTVKVTDPQGAVVPRARVAAFRADSAQAVDVTQTSAEGVARFDLPDGSYRVQVLAPGFAAVTLDTKAPASLAVELRIGAAGETVEVSAARTPVSGEIAAASTSLLTGIELAGMQPVAASEALRFTPGVVVNTAGRRGGMASIFIRGGDSRYTKVYVDDVPVNDPGGTIDLGVIPMEEVERVETMRGASSALYGSDAMTGTVQIFTRNGSTPVPELRFGLEGGTFESLRGYGSLAGAHGRFDYNLFAQGFATEGQGVNDEYSNASQGANLGVRLAERAWFRLRARHNNSFSGVQSFWKYNGQVVMPPEGEQFARQNNFLASAELTLAAPARWTHRVVGFEYNHKRRNVDEVMEEARGWWDFPFTDMANINRAGLDYSGEFLARDWARTSFGYLFEVENGFLGDDASPTKGLRRNHEVFLQQLLTWRRVSVLGGARYVRNESFGDRVVPRLAASWNVIGTTRVRAAYSEGIKEPRFEESFGLGGFIIPNTALKAERNRSWEAGVQQSLFGQRATVSAVYFNNRFGDQIGFAYNAETFEGQYVNINRAKAHGVEVELGAQVTSRLMLDAGYVHTSTRIEEAPLCGAFCDPQLGEGAPLQRRPKHSASLLATYAATRWGGTFGVTALGRRPDNTFGAAAINYAAGYARVDTGAWIAVTPRVTWYGNVENLLNRQYEEVAGYPALRLNFRTGMRFRFGGE